MGNETEPTPGPVEVPEGPTTEPGTPGLKSNEEIVSEMLAGRWGRGLARKAKLQEAGYNVSELEALYQKAVRRV